ncbi:ABC transporter permease [Pseudacidovorax sp. RU35E]|uniref:ABC transporter permease n=1 Tax=Pseudacidovorax sp. RU35E TaxID=1907403 RepID=UPI000954B3BA|nr:ABC transporter permease subunit [Pseudacidovorax sp. RU35E]SIR71178.1 amino acid ABC transporter membrane protein 2, PAAT family [Pseudacidovorax sp. RU35E]
MFDITLLWSVLPTLLAAAQLTLLLTALVILLGMALALPVALCVNSGFRLVRAAAQGYMLFFRGTPALVQLFLLYYGAGQFDVVRESFLWPVLRNPFWCVVIALGLNSAAYAGKTLGAALDAIPRGIQEAAFMLGLSPSQRFWRIDLPLALRATLPALGNDVILTCKATSLASTVTLLELTGTARLLTSETYAPYEVFFGAGLVYLAINYLLMSGLRRLERTFNVQTASPSQ